MDDTDSSSGRQPVIPDILRRLDRWLRWGYQGAEGSKTKVPDCSTRKPEQWRTLAQVVGQGPVDSAGGIGFVMTGGVAHEDGRLYALDLDACRDPLTGSVEAWARELVDYYGRTFTEITVSGTGLRIWIICRSFPQGLAKAKVKLDYDRAPNTGTKSVEIQVFGYGVPQYVTVTGNLLPGCSDTINVHENLDHLSRTFGVQESEGIISATAGDNLPKGAGEAPSVDMIEAVLRRSPEAELIFDADYIGREGEDSSASGAYWQVAQHAIRAAEGHGKAALDFLLERTAWGIGDVEDSKQPDKYTRPSWVAAELKRAAGKSGGGAHAAADIFEIITPAAAEAAVELIEEGVATVKRARTAASPILTVQPPRPPWFDRPPPPREYLLEHPNGDGLLPRGKVGLFSAAGGTGKTTALVQLAISVALRRPWFDHFNIGKKAGDRVLLLLGEEDADEVARKIYYTCADLGLAPAERREVEELVVPIGLAGHALPLLRGADNSNCEGTEHGDAILELLHAKENWGLVVIDPVSRFTAVNVESDNIIATRYIQELERFTQTPGKPTVLAVGHTSKADRQAGEANQRGVTGLFDAVRWAATLNAKSKHRVEFEAKKNNLGPPSDMVPLLRGDHGLLRAEAPQQRVEREEAEQAAAEADRTAAEAVKESRRRVGFDQRIANLTDKCLDFVRRRPGQTKSQVAAALGGRKSDAMTTIDKLAANGMIEARREGNSTLHFIAELFK
jgi:hypothetical protein